MRFHSAWEPLSSVRLKRTVRRHGRFPSLAACNGATRRRLLPPAFEGPRVRGEAPRRMFGSAEWTTSSRQARAFSRSHAGCPLCDSCRNVLLLFNACRLYRLSDRSRHDGSPSVCSIACGAQSCNPPGWPSFRRPRSAKMHYISPLFRELGECSAFVHYMRPVRQSELGIKCIFAPNEIFPAIGAEIRCIFALCRTNGQRRIGPEPSAGPKLSTRNVNPAASAGAAPLSPGRAARSSRSGPNRASGPSRPRGSA